MLSETIKLGGDTDTISSMAGAIWGAFNGSSSIEKNAKSIEQNQNMMKLAETLFLKQHH